MEDTSSHFISPCCFYWLAKCQGNNLSDIVICSILQTFFL
jgi:hypothetical protein